MTYCVYTTIYKGSKMPGKYIGSSSIERVKSGYRGTVTSKKWKQIWQEELKSNPDLFETNVTSVHITRKEATVEELRLQKLMGVVRSEEWINEGYAQPNGYVGRCVKGDLNPNYGNGHKIKEWCASNPKKASERNRKAAVTQWSNPKTRADKIAAMQGHTKTYKDHDAFIKEQQRKSLLSKEKNSLRLEYNGITYIGWRELVEGTGVSQHLYKKYYLKGEDPSDRIGKNGPVPCIQKGGSRL